MLRFVSGVTKALVALVVCVCVCTTAAYAACTIGSKVGTITPSTTYYDDGVGPHPPITLTYEVVYTFIESDGTTGTPCPTTPITITVTPTPIDGTFSTPSCDVTFAGIPDPAIGESRSGICTIDWTPPANPFTSYTHDAVGIASPVSPPFDILFGSRRVYRKPTATLSSNRNGNEQGPINGRISVALSHAVPDPVTYSLRYSGTASRGPDYTALSAVTIPANTNSTFIQIGTVDDLLVEPTETVTVELNTVASGPGAIPFPNVPATISIFDNDRATVSIGNTRNGREAGPVNGLMTVAMTGTFSTPTRVNYTVSGTATSGSDYTALPGFIIIPAFSSSGTITIPVIDDLISESSETVVVRLTSVTNPAASLSATRTATNTIADNDRAGLDVDGSPVVVSENGTTDTFAVALTARPTGTVTIAITGNDATEASLSRSSLTFTTANWNVPQVVTVRGVDDTLTDGDISFNLTLTPSGGGYTSALRQTVRVTNLDNDVRGLRIRNTAVTVRESGTSQVIGVKLAAPPAGNVTVSITGNDSTEGSLSRSSFNFTAANWNTEQTVTVTGVDDAIQDGDISYTLRFNPSGSGYGTSQIRTARVTNLDDDTAGVIVSRSSVVVSEPGTSATTSLSLRTRPTGNVTLSFTATDATEARIAVPSITFTPGNWNTAQTVTIIAVDDTLIDGSIASRMTIRSASADANYNNRTISPVSITTRDNEQPAFIVSGGPITVSESGTTGTFTVVLGTQPTSPVRFTIQTTDATESSVGPTVITFTSANWNTPQTITVTGVDDTAIDGDISSTIIVTPDRSFNPSFTPPAQNVAVTTRDDDTNVGPGDNEVTRTFREITTNFMARRALMMANHEPEIYRMQNRQGSRGFAAEGNGRSVKGDFALNSERRNGMLVWTEGQFAVYSNAAEASASRDGNFFIGYAGIDWEVYDTLALGLMMQADWAEEETATTSVDGTGWMIGPYLTSEPAENIFFDARALWGISRNSAYAEVRNVVHEGDFDTNRWLAEARLAGSFDMTPFTFQPDLTFTYLRDDQLDYEVASVLRRQAIEGETITLGQLSAGFKMIYSIRKDEALIEPFVAGRMSWLFDAPELIEVSGQRRNMDNLYGSLSAGLAYTSGRTKLSLEAGIEGLASDEPNAFSGTVAFSYRF